ncbi:MAG: IS110 family transposase [bacterium]
MYAGTNLGIDLGVTTKHRACALCADGQKRVMSFDPTPAGLDALLEAVGGPDHVDAVMEPTGLSWVAPSVYLARRGVCVYRADTRKAHGFRKVLSRDVKSDQADAEALAQMLVIAPSHVRPLPSFDGPGFVLKRLMKTREGLVDDRSRVVVRIKALLPVYTPTLVPQLAERSLGAVERVLLRDFLDPKATLDVGPAGLHAAVDAAGLDSRAPRAAALIAAWVEGAEHTRALYGGRVPFDFAQRQMRVLLDQYDGFAPLIEAVEDDIAALYAALDPDRLYETVPGVGPVVGASVCAIVGGPEALVRCFPDAAHLVSFAGLDPRKNQSGGSDREGQHISKSGSRQMRRYLFLAAETARRRDPELAAFYARLVARGKHHTCAVLAVAAKLLRRLYAVCKRAVAGDDGGYVMRDVDGTALTRREAAEVVRRRHPSKAARALAEREARAAKKAERRAAQKTRQSDDSSRRSRPLGPVGEYTVGGAARVPSTGVGEAGSVGDSSCGGLRS